MNKTPLTCLVVVVAGLLLADVIPPDSHTASRSVCVTNVSAYPAIALVGIVKGAGSAKDTIYSIKDSVPLYKGYRFSTLDLFGIDAALLDSLDVSDSLMMKHIYAKYSPAEVADPSGSVVPNTNPLESEQYFYRVEAVTDTALNLKLFRCIQKFNDGTPDRTTDF
jgi:hypothetical protein